MLSKLDFRSTCVFHDILVESSIECVEAFDIDDIRINVDEDNVDHIHIHFLIP